MDPKLAELATLGEGPSADGQLFGDNFIKEISRYVATLSSIDKAQLSLKKVFSQHVFTRSGRKGVVLLVEDNLIQGPSTIIKEATTITNTGDPHFTRKADEVAGHTTKTIPGTTMLLVSVKPVPSFLAGRVSKCFQRWSQLTSDQWVLHTVQGYQIEFYQKPIQASFPHNIHFSQTDSNLVSQEIKSPLKRSSSSHNTRFFRIFKYSFSGQKEEQKIKTGNKLTTFQPFRSMLSLQNGNNFTSQRLSSTVRLDGSFRFERCISFCSHPFRFSDLSKIQVAEQFFSISWPFLLVFLRLLGFSPNS